MSHQTSIIIADTIRIGVIFTSALNAGLVCAILGVYLIANKHIQKVDEATRGTLVRYVVAVSFSYALLAAFAIAEVQGYYGSPLTYRAPIGLAAGLLGVYAFVNMLMFENSRLDRRDDLIHMEGTPDT